LDNDLGRPHRGGVVVPWHCAVLMSMGKKVQPTVSFKLIFSFSWTA
jgi:hypothetical protein